MKKITDTIDKFSFIIYIVIGTLSICALITNIILFISAQYEYQYLEDDCIVESVEFKEGGVVTIPDEYTTYINYNDIIFKLKDKESYKYCENKVGKEIKCKIRRTIYTDKEYKDRIISIIGVEENE